MASARPLRPRLQATLAVAVGSIIFWSIGGPVTAMILGVLILLAVLAWIAPEVYALVQRGLDRFAHAIATACSWFLLGLIYFGVFVPMRFVRAFTGKKAFPVRPTSDVQTYFETSNVEPVERFERQF